MNDNFYCDDDTPTQQSIIIGPQLQTCFNYKVNGTQQNMLVAILSKQQLQGQATKAGKPDLYMLQMDFPTIYFKMHVCFPN